MARCQLRWKAKGTDKTFGAHLTSDGSLRASSLLSRLLNLASGDASRMCILLDEPELGLHPAAVTLIGDMIKSLATERQIIVATQSPLLVDTFDLDEILVLDLEDGRTRFRSLDPDEYQQWLDELHVRRALAEESHRRPPVIRLAISVEGKTEEEFVKRVLAEHLRAKGVEPQPVLIGTGGNVTVERLTSEMAKLYWSFDAVTSLVDFYGFRDKANRSVEQLERHLLEKVRDRIHPRKWVETKVFPYVQRHEFEGLLFSDVNAFTSVMELPEGSAVGLRRIRSQFPTPEDINDEPETAPSKCIVRTVSMYRKALHGPLIASTVGLDAIREECPRFNEWVERLESLP